MKLYSDKELSELLDQPIFRLIGDCADELGVECYVVGGYVRDIFLERPSKDIDVVVVGSGIEVARRLKEKLGRKAHLSVFKNFGTAQVKAPSNLPPLGEATVVEHYQTASPMNYDILKKNAAEHRKNPTEAESAMWELLREKNVGEKFRRQHIIGENIVDFVNIKHQLAIEIDGGYHFTPEQQEYDRHRTEA